MFGSKLRFGLLLLGILTGELLTAGNPEVTTHNLKWIRWIGAGDISQHLSWKTEIEQRALLPWRQFQFLSRTHVLYHNEKSPQLGLGLTFTRFSRENPDDSSELLHNWEMRVQSEVSWKQKANNRVRFGQRIWIEERMRPDESGAFHHDNLTLRFQADMKINLWKTTDHAIDVGVFDEIFFQTLKPTRFSAFNHNRMGVNLMYTFREKYTLETGYFHWYQLGSSQQNLIQRHIFRTTFRVRF